MGVRFGLFSLVWVLGLLVAGFPIASRDGTKLRDQYQVMSLPGLDKLSETPSMYAGHLEIDADTDTNYFFWKFLKPDQSRNRTIFWLNGGPGCSSMDGALMELGPLRINDDIEVEFNNGSWYEQGDLVFVDQPGGTGFSYTNQYDRELDQVALDFLIFMARYFEVFPEDSGNEIYIAGESYAGQYIPYIARLIDEADVEYNVQGLLIGNGWISPNEQSLSYVPFMIDAGLIQQNDKYIPELLKRVTKCQDAINQNGNDKLLKVCDTILDSILRHTINETLEFNMKCINMYDYRLRDSYPSCGMNWPPLLPLVTTFLQDETVMASLNLKKMNSWTECASKVSRALTLLNSKLAIVFLPELLQKYKIVLFNGDKDIICNSLGTKMMIENMEWGGSRGFSEDVETVDWFYNDMPAGFLQSQDNLTFINMYNASHMVAFDDSAVSRGILDIMIDNFENTGAGIKTPVYNFNDPLRNSTNGEPAQQGEPKYDDLISSHSALFYVFEIVVVCIILYGIHYFYKYYNDISSRKPSSILNSRRRDQNRKSKKVHWSDELDFTQDPTTTEEDKGKGLMNSLWTKWTLYNKVPSNDTDIEMSGGEVARNNNVNDDFIVESDEE